MPGMPYHLEKGPLLSVLDDFCNRGDDQRLLRALGRLRAGDRLRDIGAFDSPNLYNPAWPWPYDAEPNLADHFDDHWLGRPGPDHWLFYTGPVEAIMRETLIRAIELAMGVVHEPENFEPTVATRHWTIDFWWKCPQPWFEGWITWRRINCGCEDPDDDHEDCSRGHVIVLFATPSDDGVVLDDPTAEATLVGPNVTHASEGSWLIAAAKHERVNLVDVPPEVLEELASDLDLVTSVYTREGFVIYPTRWTIDNSDGNGNVDVSHADDIVVVQPRFGSGGARNGGYPYRGATP
jgi:hypothetical protein